MTKKNLHNWYLSGDITSEQKEVIGRKFTDGSPNSTYEQTLNDFKQLYHWSEILERNKYKINLPGTIQQMTFFSTWWNNNLALIINGDGDYGIWLLVFEYKTREMGEIMEKFGISDHDNYRYDLDKAKSRSWEVAWKLEGNNPILYNEPYVLRICYNNDYWSSEFPSMFKDNDREGEVKRIEVPFYSAKSNPDAYFKPLDIAKIFIKDSEDEKKYMVHACVYLGNKKICHARGGNKIEIDSWNEFFNLMSADKMLRYHPVVPFKRPEKIIEHIAKCVIGKDKYFVIKNKFVVLDRKNENMEVVRRANNCECFVNRATLGLNFSELVEMRKDGQGNIFTPNTQTYLTENENQLGSLTTYDQQSSVNNKTNEINGYKNQAMNNGEAFYAGYPMEAKIIVTKPNVKLS